MTLGLLVGLENTKKNVSYIQRIFITGPYGTPPLKIKISKIGLRSDLSWPKLGLEPKFHESGTFGGFGKREQSLSQIFNTGPYGDPPLKIKISKIGLRHVLSWPKLGLEPKCHDPGTFGGFRKQITHRQDSSTDDIKYKRVHKTEEKTT